MSEELSLTARIEAIERGYEYLLAYAAQGRQEDKGTELRDILVSMHQSLSGIGSALRAGFTEAPADLGIGDFLEAVDHDAQAARGAIGVVLSRQAIASILVDNLNASVHLRALLTDVFLIEQALKPALRT